MHCIKKRQSVLPTMTTDMNDNYPQQVSDDQARSERSKMVLSTGISLPANFHCDSRFVFDRREKTSHRLNGYGENPLNTYVSQAQQSRQGNEVRSPTIRSNISNNPVITRPPRHPDYVDSSERRRSYDRWWHRKPDPQTLTNAGFFYTNEGDLVRCFQCGIGLKDFCEEDNPLNEHLKHSGDCPYLLEYLGASQLAAIRRRLQSSDPEFNRRMQWNGRHRQDPENAVYRHPGYQTLESRPASFLNWPPHMMQTPEQSEDDMIEEILKSVTVVFCDTGRHRQDPANAVCRHPGYQTFESRSASFLNRPPHTMQTPAQSIEAMIYQRLEAAGFHDKGHGDGVCCFACDGGLQHWQPEDDPWIEHCRLFPACPFARIQKGDYFIELIQTSIKNQLETFTENGMSLGLEELKQRDPELQDAMDGRKAVCKEMGFLAKEINEAINELREKGTRNPSVEEIIDVMDVIKRRKMLQAVANETPAEENQRLKRIIRGFQRDQNKTNCHSECMECAEPLSKCKVCGNVNRNKIRTIKIELI